MVATSQKQKTAYEIMPSLVGSEMCIRDRFRIVRDLSGIGLSDGPPPSFSPDLFAAFFKSKVEAIRQDLSPFLNTVSRVEMSSAPSCPVIFDSFQPVTPDSVARVLDRC